MIAYTSLLYTLKIQQEVTSQCCLEKMPYHSRCHMYVSLVCVAREVVQTSFLYRCSSYCLFQFQI